MYYVQWTDISGATQRSQDYQELSDAIAAVDGIKDDGLHLDINVMDENGQSVYYV
jgi:hypothetical protein